MELFLIRHGDVALAKNINDEELIYNLDTPKNTAHLSDKGKKQLEALGKKLQSDGMRINVLLTSPYARARESAAIIQNYLTAPTFTIVHDLHDVYAPGYISWTKTRFVKEVGGDIYGRPKLTDDQESLEELIKRAAKTIKTISLDYAGNSIAIVSHGDFLDALVWTLQNPENIPRTYAELNQNFFLEKGQACTLLLDSSLHLLADPELITVNEVESSIETWRRGHAKRG